MTVVEKERPMKKKSHWREIKPVGGVRLPAEIAPVFRGVRLQPTIEIVTVLGARGREGAKPTVTPRPIPRRPRLNTRLNFL